MFQLVTFILGGVCALATLVIAVVCCLLIGFDTSNVSRRQRWDSYFISLILVILREMSKMTKPGLKNTWTSVQGSHQGKDSPSLDTIPRMEGWIFLTSQNPFENVDRSEDPSSPLFMTFNFIDDTTPTWYTRLEARLRSLQTDPGLATLLAAESSQNQSSNSNTFISPVHSTKTPSQKSTKEDKESLTSSSSSEGVNASSTPLTPIRPPASLAVEKKYAVLLNNILFLYDQNPKKAKEKPSASFFSTDKLSAPISSSFNYLKNNVRRISQKFKSNSPAEVEQTNQRKSGTSKLANTMTDSALDRDGNRGDGNEPVDEQDKECHTVSHDEQSASRLKKATNTDQRASGQVNHLTNSHDSSSDTADDVDDSSIRSGGSGSLTNHQTGTKPLLSSEKKDNSRGLILLDECVIDLFPRDAMSHELWLKEFPLVISHPDRAILHHRQQLYIFCDSCPNKEKWFYELERASCLSKQAFEAEERLGRQQVKDAMAEIHKATEHLTGTDAMLNVLFQRMFWSLSMAPAIHSNLQDKINRRLQRVPRPTFLQDIVCTRLSIGQLFPCFSRGQVVELKETGELVFEVFLEYGQPRKTEPSTAEDQPSNEEQDELVDDAQEATPSAPDIDDTNPMKYFTVDMSTKLTLFNFSLELQMSMQLRYFSGLARFSMKAPPTERLFMGFQTMPDVDIHIEPSVGQAKLSHWPWVMPIIEKMVREMMLESMILPQMDDMIAFGELISEGAVHQCKLDVSSNFRRKKSDPHPAMSGHPIVASTDSSIRSPSLIDLPTTPQQDDEHVLRKRSIKQSSNTTTAL